MRKIIIAVLVALMFASPAFAHNVYLEQNPTPIGETVFIVEIEEYEAVVTLRIYDLAGDVVRTLLADSWLGRGTHEIQWNGRSDTGGLVGSGVYIYFVAIVGYNKVWTEVGAVGVHR